MPVSRPRTLLRPKACRWWQAELLCAALALAALQAFFRAVQQSPAPPQPSPTEAVHPPDGDQKLPSPLAKPYSGSNTLARAQGIAGSSGAMFCASVVLLWGASLAKEIGITFVRLGCMVLCGVA